MSGKINQGVFVPEVFRRCKIYFYVSGTKDLIDMYVFPLENNNWWPEHFGQFKKFYTGARRKKDAMTIIKRKLISFSKQFKNKHTNRV